MGFTDKLKALFRGKGAETGATPAEIPAPAAGKAAWPKKACKGCGKTFAYDPSLDFVPNFCRECKKRHDAEKEEKQRAGAPRKISRKCKACGGYFSFENTLEHYPTYCPNCRKRHKAEMKAKYGAGKKGKREDGGQ